MPVLCNYYVTYRCNATCDFCDIWEQPSPMIALDDVEANLRDLRRLGVRIIDFTGGEPLLHTELDQFLGLAKEMGFKTTVTTNGLLYPKRAKSLAGKVDLLHFSIDSSDREEHNESRGVNCFDKLMESIEVALSIGERPDLLFTVNNENVHRLAEVYENISRPNGLVLIINPLFSYHGKGGELNAEVIDHIREFGRKSLAYLNPAFLSLRQAGGNDTDHPVCKAVSTTVVISPFNEVVLPCYHAGLEKIAIDKQLFDVWNSDAVKEHERTQGTLPVCSGCSINCYFEPSFATSPGHKYFWESLPSKARYTWVKFLEQRLDARRHPVKQAILPPRDIQPDRVEVTV